MPKRRDNTEDEIMRETRKIKTELAKAFDYNVDRILEDARKKEKTRGRKILSPPVRHGSTSR